jgi:hypothetical protein
VDASEVQIRRADADEWDTVRDVRLAALADAPEAFAATLGQELDRTEPEWRARISAWPWFVAWRAGFRPTGRRQLHHRSGAADLDEVELARAIDGGP